MKILIISMLIMFSSASYADDISDAKEFINGEIVEMINILNRLFTSLSFTSCASISDGSANVTVNSWDSGLGQYVPTVERVDIELATPASYDRKLKMYVDGDFALPVAVIEFNCDMKKGRLIQTGKNWVNSFTRKVEYGVNNNDDTTADIVDITWDNTGATPTVDFKIVGPTMGDKFIQRPAGQAFGFGGAGAITSYADIGALVTLFGLNHAGLKYADNSNYVIQYQ